MTQEWIVVALTVVGIAAALLSAWLGRQLWLKRVRRQLVMLFSSREALTSAARSLNELIERLAEAGDDVWVLFVEDSESDERRAVGEIAHRMDMLAVELEAMPLPRVLHELADALQRIAGEIRDMTVAIDRAASPDEVLNALEGVDLPWIAQRMTETDRMLGELQGTFKVTDPAVYGGGLYI